MKIAGAFTGSLTIASAAGLPKLAGFNLLNPNPTNALTAWTGSISVGSGAGNISLTPRPYYSQPSALLAGLSAGSEGGAVGVAPYRLYAADCVPRHYDDWHYAADVAAWPSSCWPMDLLVNSYFGLPTLGANGQPDPRKQHATIRFYGPVWTEAQATDGFELQPYQVLQYVAVNPYRVFWADVTEAMKVTMARTEAEASRAITVAARDQGALMQAGFYAVVFNTTPPANPGTDRYALYCGGVGLPHVAPVINVDGLVAYYFRLYPDCNEDGCIDSWDHMCGQIPGTCYADLDDGTGTGTPDGGVDINDLLYFLVQYEAGSLNADLDDGNGTGNPDYGVDINDLLFFLVHYEGGC